MNTNEFTPKPMTAKNAKIITDYLDLKLNELTDGINYWNREDRNTENNEQRAKECKTNLFCLKSSYNEIYSMFNQLKQDYSI